MMHVLSVLVWIKVSAALALNICSRQNLGLNYVSNQYMSNGFCRDHCNGGGFAVAITQNYDCWCSNSVPADTVDTSACDTGCPGYSEQEKCGGNGVYGYVVFGSASTVSALSSSSSSSSSTTSTNRSSSRTSRLLSASTSSTSTASSSAPTSSSSSVSSSTAETSSSSSSSSSSSFPSSSLITSSTLPHNEHATTIVSVVTIHGSETQMVSTKYITAVPSSSSLGLSLPPAQRKNAFFDSSAKVAGTFTAVGVVVVALIATLLYCCCFAAGAHADEYSDEEKQYSSDENSIIKKERAPVAEFGAKLRSSTNSNLKRNLSSKSIISLFTSAGAGSDMSRSQSRKKLNPKNEPLGDSGPIMSPILELDHRLDPRAMFEEYNSSAVSLNDENDYSRRIWHVTNPG